MTKKGSMPHFLIDTDGITISTTPTYKTPPGLIHLFIWFFFTIANIANCDQIDPYISQVIGNHLTSTGLSMAKH
jgi:hypothetical protein